MEIGIVLASLFLSLICLIVFQKLYIKHNIIDRINERSSHNTIATRTGGLAIYLPLFLVSVCFYIAGVEAFNYSLLLPLSILLVVGCYDDVYQVDFKLKFLFQIIVAKIIIDNGLIIDNMHGILGINELNRILAQLLTIFVIVAIINAINFIDGLDGLALSIISIFIISFEFFSMKTTAFKYLSLSLIPTFIPLLYFNFKKKKKVFLGDSGSLFLGGIVSIYVLEILSPTYLIKSEFDLNKVLFVLSILFYPIVDLLRVFAIRIANKKSPFIADKNHIHHYLNNKFNRHWQVTLILSLSTILAIIILQTVNLN